MGAISTSAPALIAQGLSMISLRLGAGMRKFKLSLASAVSAQVMSRAFYTTLKINEMGRGGVREVGQVKTDG